MAEGKAKKMWALPGAQLTAPQSLLMHGGDATLMLDLPCPSFLIEHPKGLVLFDTGCNPKIIDDAVGYWGDVAAHLPLKWNKADTLDKQIQGVGYKTSDVKYVILVALASGSLGRTDLFPQCHVPGREPRAAVRLLARRGSSMGIHPQRFPADSRLQVDGAGLRFRPVWRRRAAIPVDAWPYARRVLVAGESAQSQVPAHGRHHASARRGQPGGNDGNRRRSVQVDPFAAAYQGDPRHAGRHDVDHARS